MTAEHDPQAALRRAGDLHGARAAALEAFAAAPNAPAPHDALGDIGAALGDEAGAVAAFAEALRRAPGWADAWIGARCCRTRS